MWKEGSVKGVGHLSHLYTRIAAGRETDDIERWLDREFEAPAAMPLQKATSGCRLTQEDWGHLVRYLAAQMVRTPAYLLENLPRWNADASSLLNSTLQKSVHKLEAAKNAGKAIEVSETPNSQYLPFRVITKVQPGQKLGQLGAKMVVGRGLWLFNMRHLLSDAGATRLLHEHKWSILAPCEGLTWFTSDDPVIRLNYYEPGRYDFKGGIAKSGTEILLPLSPHHLLYTRVGYRPPRSGTALPREQTEAIRRFLAEHAFRMIFAASPEEDVARLRPRTVDHEAVRYERQKWQDWHAEQAAAERDLTDSET